MWKPKQRRTWPWRDYLTKDEAREISLLEIKAGEIDEQRRELTAKRHLIANRATRRAIEASRTQ